MKNKKRNKPYAPKHSKSKAQMINYIVSQGESYGLATQDMAWNEHLETMTSTLKVLFCNNLSLKAVERMYACRDADKYGALVCLFVMCYCFLCAKTNGDREWAENFALNIARLLSILNDSAFHEAASLILQVSIDYQKDILNPENNG